MKKSELLRELEAAIDIPADSLNETRLLEDIPEWDSLAVIIFIALVDEKLGLMVEGEAIVSAQSVADLLALVGKGLEDYDQAA